MSLWTQVRCLVAELLLGLAFDIYPDEAPGKLPLSAAIGRHFQSVAQFKARNW